METSADSLLRSLEDNLTHLLVITHHHHIPWHLLGTSTHAPLLCSNLGHCSHQKLLHSDYGDLHQPCVAPCAYAL